MSWAEGQGCTDVFYIQKSEICLALQGHQGFIVCLISTRCCSTNLEILRLKTLQWYMFGLYFLGNYKIMFYCKQQQCFLLSVFSQQ